MGIDLESGRSARPTGTRLSGLRFLTGQPAIFVALTLIIWVGMSLLSEETGLRFGLGYRVFFSVVLLLSISLFWLLGKESVPVPRSTMGVLGSLGAVLVLTVAILVAAGIAYPQFDLPQPPKGIALEASDRGDDLFWSGSVGCFRCHAISGTGGTRGPDLTQVASRAGERVPDMTAEQYLLGKVKTGKSFRYNVPEYTPMMPEFEKMLDEDQLLDLVAYLLLLE